MGLMVMSNALHGATLVQLDFVFALIGRVTVYSLDYCHIIDCGA